MDALRLLVLVCLAAVALALFFYLLFWLVRWVQDSGQGRTRVGSEVDPEATQLKKREEDDSGDPVNEEVE